MLSEAKLNRIIESVINEAIPNSKYQNWKNRAKSGNAGAQQSASKGGHIQVGNISDKTVTDANGNNSEYVEVGLGHVYANKAQELADRINATVPPTVMRAKTSNGNDRVVLCIPKDKIADVPKVASQLESAIKSLSQYSEEYVERLCKNLQYSIEDRVTEEDNINAEKSKISNWKDLMSRLDDPEVRKRLLMLQTTENYGRQYGHVLSQNNIKEILLQMPTASFVTTRSGWAVFDRVVNPGARRIRYTLKIDSGYGNGSAYDDVARRLGFKDYKEAKSLGSQHILHKINVEVGNKGYGKFQKVIGYDVSDTTPIDPNNDKWAQEIGLLSNLTGALNQSAIDYDQKIDPNSAQGKIVAANKENIETAKKNEMPTRRKAMEYLCRKNPWGVQVDTRPLSGMDDVNFIVRSVYSLALQSSPFFGLVKQGDMERIAMLCVVAICVTSGIASKDINSMRIYIPNHITDEDAMISFTISDRIIQKFGNDIRPNVKNVLKNEGMMRERRMIREKKEISPSQFISLVKNRYGILPPEETDEMSENRRIIKRIVNEEIRRMLYNKNRRR